MGLERELPAPSDETIDLHRVQTEETIVLSPAAMARKLEEMAQEATEERIPSSFGDFQVLQHLGSGGMGDVLLVQPDLKLKRARIKEAFETEFQEPETLDYDIIENLAASLGLTQEQQTRFKTALDTLRESRKGEEKGKWEASIDAKTRLEYKKQVNELLSGINQVFDRCHELAGIYGLEEPVIKESDLPDLQFALKTLNSSLAGSVEHVERFKEESNVLKGKLAKDPGIIKVFGQGEFQGMPYILLEYLPGEIPEGKIEQRTALFITKALARSLHFAHQNGVVHRDLKPENVRSRKPAGQPWQESDIVLTDLGIAKDKSRKTLTEQGTVFGTPDYMSPEQAGGQTLDGRSDIYSLGVMLYEFLTGKKIAYESRFKPDEKLIGANPERAEMMALLNVISDTKADILFYPREFNPEIPKPLENIVLKMLEKDPAKRYQTTLELRADIERFEKGEKVKAPNYNWRRLRRRAGMHPVRYISAAVLSLALSIGGGFYYSYTQTLDYLIGRMPAAAASHNEIDNFSDSLLRRIYARKLNLLIRRMPSNLFPRGIEAGSNEWETAQGKHETSGRWTHLLWTAYKETRNERYREAAEQWTRQLHSSNFRTLDELGSFIFDSYVIGFELTRNEEFKNVALDAASKIASSYNQEKGFIEMDTKAYPCILNVRTVGYTAPLLLWASENAETHEEKEIYRSIALEHARATARHCIREDGSTIELAVINPQAQKVSNWHGFQPKTREHANIQFCYSRGHAEAMSGFISLYAETKQEEFLRIAEKLADFYIANVPQETVRADEAFAAIAHVPFYDFRDPGIQSSPEQVPKDSSAAGIAALSLYKLSKLEPDQNKAQRYRQEAYNILMSLHRNCFISDEDNQGILRFATGNANQQGFVNGSLISGDDAYLTLMAELER